MKELIIIIELSVLVCILLGLRQVSWENEAAERRAKCVSAYGVDQCDFLDALTMWQPYSDDVVESCMRSGRGDAFECWSLIKKN